MNTLRLIYAGWRFQFKQPGLIATEFAIGVVYTFVGYQFLRVMEYASRRRVAIQIA